MKNFLFIINPVSGNGKWEKVRPVFENATRDLANTRYFFTRYPGNGREIAEEQKNNFDVIVAVGGDGTVHEVINGFGEDSKNIFAVLPIGSGNDFAHAINMSNNFTDNLNMILQAKHVKFLDMPKISYTDLDSLDSDHDSPDKNHDIHESYFINSLGIGFDALVSHLSKENIALKGIFRYLLAVFKALIRYKALDVEADFDGEKFSGKKLLIAVGNGKTSGGGFYLNPAAEPDDKQLDVCMADDFSFFKILRVLPLTLFGKHIKTSGINNFAFKKATINLKEPNYLHMEGEVATKNLREVTIELSEKRLPVIVP